jgi:hypothetical protein
MSDYYFALPYLCTLMLLSMDINQAQNNIFITSPMFGFIL